VLGAHFHRLLLRHCFVWLSFRQSTEAVIAGFEAAWGFFEGTFKVVIFENVPRPFSRITTGNIPLKYCQAASNPFITSCIV
jgi:hypothetical protein